MTEQGEGAVVLDAETDLSYSFVRRKEIVVATPSSSWTLLESMIETASIENDEPLFKEEESDDEAEEVEDDDGLAEEEERLERVSERLEALEREGPKLILEAEDVAAADEAINSCTKTPSTKKRYRTVYHYLAIYFVLLLVSTALGFLRQTNVITQEEVDLPTPTEDNSDLYIHAVEKPISELLFPQEAMIQINKTFFIPEIEHAVTRTAEQLTQNNGLKLICSAGLGALGLAVGIPYVPGITDNLVVGIAAAALPLFSSNREEEKQQAPPTATMHPVTDQD